MRESQVNKNNLFKVWQTLTVGVVMTFSQMGWCLSYSSEIFELDSNFQKKLFDLQVESATGADNVVTATGTFKDSSTGQVAVHDVTKYKDAELIEVEIEQKQTGEKGRVEVKGDEVHFSYTSPEGKQRKTVEKIKKGMRVLASSNFIVFIQKYWAELQKEKTISVRFAVWDREETVGFDIILEGAEKKSGQDLMKVKVKPTSFIIAALVNPLQMWFSPDGKKLVEMRGRVGPKIKVGKKWKTLDADVKYSY